jgi:DNA-binding protein H-NS
MHPALIKILQISHNSLTGIVRNEQESVWFLTNNVSIPVNYLGRYVDSFKTASQNRQHAQELLIQSLKEEQEKKKKLENIQGVLGITSPAINPNVIIKSGYPEQNQFENADLNDNTEMREEDLNLAKLTLVDAENLVELRKTEEETITRLFRNDCVRLNDFHKKKLTVTKFQPSIFLF